MAEKFTETPLLTPRFDHAMQIALDHHRNQLRKATEVPYASHLLAVTAIVLELGGSEDEAIAALLHDAVEDGGGPEMQARITAEFGAAVGTMVAQNSDTDQDDKEDWSERKATYLAGMPAKSTGALRVSLADKLHNARSITADVACEGDAVWSRFTATRAETVGHYRALAAAFEKELPRLGTSAKPAAEELRRLVEGFGA